MKNHVWKSNWRKVVVKRQISKPSNPHRSFFQRKIILFRASRNDRDTRVYESRLKQYENEIGELKARVDTITLDATRRIEENEVHTIMIDYFVHSIFLFLQVLLTLTNDLERQVTALKRQLESETLLRVDLENKNKTLREELQFNQNVYETVRTILVIRIHVVLFQKICQFKEQQRIEILHDDGLRQQYDDRLLQELQQLRTQNDQEMQLLRDEIAAQYEKKV